MNLLISARRRRSSGGFTLIELLVVVSIISLLISILLPTLKRTREQAKSLVCLANLHSVSSGSAVYAAEDPAESAIPVHHLAVQPSSATLPDEYRREIVAYCYGGKSGRGKELDYPFFWGTGGYKGPVTRPLNRVFYKTGFADYKYKPGPGLANWISDEKLRLDQYECPSDDGYRGLNALTWKESRLSSYDHYGTSYTANRLYVYSPPSSTCGSIAPAFRPLSRIPTPSYTIHYEENAGSRTYWADPQGLANRSCGPTKYPGVVVKGWHGREWIFNVAFVDAHATTLRIKGFENPELSHYPSHDADYWSCLIVRGSGFQRDVLPSPPVLTNLNCDEVTIIAPPAGSGYGG